MSKTYGIEKVLVHLGKLGGQLLFVVTHVPQFVTSAETFIPKIELWSPEKLSCHLGNPVHHLLLLDVAHDHIVNHFLGLTQQAPVNPSLPPNNNHQKWGLMRMMTAFSLSLVGR